MNTLDLDFCIQMEMIGHASSEVCADIEVIVWVLYRCREMELRKCTIKEVSAIVEIIIDFCIHANLRYSLLLWGNEAESV